VNVKVRKKLILCGLRRLAWATTGPKTSILFYRPKNVLARPPGAPTGTAAQIAISQSGRAVYASNRGHDSIAHFPTDETTGLLGGAQWTPCHGREPRFFVLTPDARSLAAGCSLLLLDFPLVGRVLL